MAISLSVRRNYDVTMPALHTPLPVVKTPVHSLSMDSYANVYGMGGNSFVTRKKVRWVLERESGSQDLQVCD